MLRNENVNINKRILAKILSKIPWDIWEKIVEKEPEWQNMECFFLPYGFGPFATLMLATGLNDYQLKGKAEIVYWPKIRTVLNNSILTPPKSPDDLYNLLEPFYQKERFKINKIERLYRFLKSSLASQLWVSTPQKVSADFLDIWNKLAEIMHQNPQDKTIVFAMKCLGISLLIAKEYRFDFSPIPVPVDLRVRKFTNLLGFNPSSDDDVRDFWSDILSIIRRRDSRITMIHLDSLVWQISSMNKYELQKYFIDLGIPRIGEYLCTLLQL
ncbi:MAG: N-glycosylase/DNA lyase [Candidatus Omnitrophica bacterium]|nr:N-glycosylase/DNA lyase [Candidatus Omnitrophota bacterium]MCM8803355.1 N-glycosylase/DNA lyase [Candidatus Omnitrophota bacterium]